MKFSVITPVFNGMPWIERCVASVRGQPGVQVQHLIQDAVSTDGTSQWLSRQPNLAVRTEPDDGMYDAINRGFARAEGDVLSWLNSDEQYLPGTLQVIHEAAERYLDADAFFGDCILVDRYGRPLDARKEIPLRRWQVENGLLFAKSCTMFFRRRVWEQCGDFDTDYKIAGDMEWVLRLLSRGIRFRHIPSFLALFTISDRNLSLDPRAREEVEQIRRRYGAYRVRWMRLVPRICRWMEKALRGCYGRHHIRYRSFNRGGEAEEVDTVVGSSWKWLDP